MSFSFSCKKKSPEPEPEEISVVHGKVYGKSFTMVSGRAITDVYNGTERAEVNLSANANFNCTSTSLRSYSVYFRIPKKVGIYTEQSDDIWLGFNSSTSDDNVGFVNVDSKVEVTEVTAGRIKGKISFADPQSSSDVAGTFDVAFCPR